MTIAVIDYGIGNVQSVVNAGARIEPMTMRVRSGNELKEMNPSKIILPGVGAIGAALMRMRKHGFEEALTHLVRERRTPFLGICVGMQMLADTCEEFGTHRGLSWIPGRVRHLKATSSDLRIPHVGWNTVNCTRNDDPVLSQLDGEDFFFVHSYAMDCDASYVAATTRYGRDFVSAVRCDNVLGVQFHPEKSARAGAQLIHSFLTS